jgi:AcrR family transcriptional regulator
MKTNKITKRQVQAMETKKRIYDSAVELFQKYGFENVSVDDIVEKSGVAKGTFYVHFNSKDSLITSEIAAYVKELDLDYKSYVETFPESTKVSDILFSLFGKIADTLADKIGYDLMKAVYEAQLSKTVNPVLLMGYSRDLYKLLTDIIDKGIQEGEFRKELSSDAVARYCVMVIRGTAYEWCARYPDFNFKEELLGLFKIMLTGIKSN